jgi:HSP20 family molecular chaperone IbpA
MAPVEKPVEFCRREIGEPTGTFFDRVRKEFEDATAGKEVNLTEEEDSPDKLRLDFQVVGLVPEELKISMTSSNFLEVEAAAGDGGSLTWAYPVGRGFKNGEIKVDFPQESKLVVTVPKDPDFKPPEEDPVGLLAFPEWEDQPEEIPAEVIEPIECQVSEAESGFVVELNVDNFEADEVTVRVANRRVLEVTGEKKKETEKPETELDQEEPRESRLSRKSFGRMFWIPDGCDPSGIEAKARKIYSYLNLEISIPRSGPEQGPEEDQAVKTIPIKLV